MHSIEAKVKQFILGEFLPGEDPEQLKPDTPLMKTGILDSLTTLRLVSFLETEFGFSVQAHEVDEENFGTLAEIGVFVRGKLAG